MKKLLIIFAILLITSFAFASIRMIGQETMKIGGGGISFYRPNSAIDYSGTYWGTAYGAMWTEAYTIDSRWAETYNTEI